MNTRWPTPRASRGVCTPHAPALFGGNRLSISREGGLPPRTLPPRAPPFVHVASGDEVLNARRVHGLYIGAEVTNGITGILCLSVLRIGQPFVRRRRFRSGDDVPARFFQEDCVNVDVICGPLEGLWRFIRVEKCSPHTRILFCLPNADFELPRNTY